MSLTSAENSPELYVFAVLEAYLGLPDTPTRTTPLDEVWARRFHQQGIPFRLLETALLLGSLRRCTRSPEAPPLPGIRCLAYFYPIVQELQHTSVSEGFRDSLRLKLQRLSAQPSKHPPPSVE